MYLTCSICFDRFLYVSTYYVYCSAPTYQDQFLVCENLLGNKSDSDINTTIHNLCTMTEDCI